MVKRGSHCDVCDKWFGTRSAFKQHKRDSPMHSMVASSTASATPLDLFFQSYPDFDYDAAASPSAEFGRLRRRERWRRGDPDADEAHDAYRSALAREFDQWYGRDANDLGSWHSLCRAIGVGAPLPDSCKACRRAVKAQHVNMIDLIEVQRRGEGTVTVFDSVDELREYTVAYRKYFPKDSLESGALLRALLREILGSLP